MNKGIQYIKVKKDIGCKLDSRIKINVMFMIPDKLSVEFLSPTSFCRIGYYKWYFKDEFNSVFEFIK